MKCLTCGSENLRVTNVVEYDNYIKRRRECNECGRRFNTQETYMEADLTDFVTIECEVCGIKVQAKTRKTKYCRECAKSIDYKNISSSHTRREKKKKTDLLALNKEAREQGLSYGKLQALKYMESQKSVLEGDE